MANLPEVERELDLEPSNFKGDDHPVEQVSWLDAVEFCARLSQHTEREYRLPSEAEWEYACRAGTTTPFHFGETITSDLANYNGDSNYNKDSAYCDGIKGVYRRGTTPVGSFGVANAFGLYDMHGNVWEWCEDDRNRTYNRAPKDGSAWIDRIRSNESVRVLRGGSWYLNPGNCRSATRNFYVAESCRDSSGFRVVYSAPRILP